MTEQEAIEWQKAFKKTYRSMPKDSGIACDMAISALEKQIPKKPINCKMSKIKTAVGWCCPSCGNELYWDTDYGQKKFIHCTECGQKLD